MSYKDYSSEEITRRGEEIYQSKLRPKVEATHRGQFLVLDIESGDYEIDDSDCEASTRLLKKHPDGVLYGVRIGHQTAYKLGRWSAGTSA